MVEASAAIDALLRERKRIAPDERAKFDVVDVLQFMQLPRRFDRATFRVKTSPAITQPKCATPFDLARMW